jgi:formate dehydrogenase subunit beta
VDYSEKIREIARELLTEHTVEVIIGFAKGTLPMTTAPVLIHRPEDTGKLYWDSFCNMNLANYLPKREGRIGIVAKGCDARNIVVHIVENQIQREQLFIIGVPCEGMVERRKIASLLAGREPHEAVESEGSITLTGAGFEQRVNREDYLQDNCLRCTHRNPVIYDALVGELVKEQAQPDPYEDVKDIEAQGADERWAFFSQLITGCTRCYACRNACPLCYCPTCFVDESDPQWVGKSIDPTDTMTFHILRAYHCAGRCTDCGACEQACPVDIKLTAFTRRLNRDTRELYGHEAGVSLEERPPLDTYRPDDDDAFIR